MTAANGALCLSVTAGAKVSERLLLPPQLSSVAFTAFPPLSAMAMSVFHPGAVWRALGVAWGHGRDVRYLCAAR